MKYILIVDYNEANELTYNSFALCSNIRKTGSVRGMQKLYGWPKGGQVRCGQFIYNIGPQNVKILTDAGLLKGK